MFVNFIIFKRFTSLVPSWPRFEKMLVLVLFLKVIKISYDSDLNGYQKTSFIISF